jgi:hypothetical protein
VVSRGAEGANPGRGLPLRPARPWCTGHAPRKSRLRPDWSVLFRMSQEAPRPSTSPQLARRLLDREAALLRDSNPEKVGAALTRTCLYVSENLRDSLGEAGWAALLARALARTEADHPALKGIRRQNEDDIDLDCVIASVAAHGVASATAAFEALLAALIEILGRLVGEDMAVRLIDHDARWPLTGGEAQGP